MNELDIILLIVFGLIFLVLVYQILYCRDDDEAEHLHVITKSNTRTGSGSGPIVVNDYAYGCACNRRKFLKHFEHFNDSGYEPDFGWLARNNLLPWWNSTRNTRNSSWDIRGDVPVASYYVGPWLNSPLI
jgi:hypothetical protein